MAFAAEDGRGKEFGAVEDVAGEDLAEMWGGGWGKLRPCTGLGRDGWVKRERRDVAEMERNMLRPYKRMEWNSRVGMQGRSGEKIVRGFRGCGGRDV